jgi:phage terminase small subunit
MRKRRVDSKEEAVNTMVAAAVITITPPEKLKLDADELEVFDEIIAEFATVDWSRHSIRLAAMLARTMNMMQKAQDEVNTDGFTVTNARGNEAMNPAMSAMNMMASQIMSMRRTLALHATAGSSKADKGKQAGHHKKQEENNPLEDDEEDLLQRPDNVVDIPRARARRK